MVKETGGKGPYCSLVLAVVVMKDVLVFICFAVNLEFTRMVSHRRQALCSRRNKFPDSLRARAVCETLGDVVQMQVTKSEGGMQLVRIMQPFVSLVLSAVWGVLAGYGMSAFTQWRPAWKSMAPLTHRLPQVLLLRCCSL